MLQKVLVHLLVLASEPFPGQRFIPSDLTASVQHIVPPAHTKLFFPVCPVPRRPVQLSFRLARAGHGAVSQEQLPSVRMREVTRSHAGPHLHFVPRASSSGDLTKHLREVIAYFEH